MTPFDEVIVRHLAALGGRRRAVRTLQLSVALGVPERTMRHYLARLERLGVLQRLPPKTGAVGRRGWLLK